MSDTLPRQVNLLQDLVRQLAEENHYQEAAGVAREVLQLVEQEQGPGHLDTFRALHSLAQLCRAAGQMQEAAAHSRRLLELQRTGQMVDDIEVSQITYELAILEERLGNVAGAEGLYREAIDLRAERLGRRHPDTTLAMNALGEFYRANGNNEAAVEIHRKALKRRRQAHGSVHIDVAHSANNLAIAMADLGQAAEAEALYTEALAIKRELIGESHFSYSVTLNNLATLFVRTGRREQAEPLLRQVISLWRDNPDASDHLIKVLQSLAELYVRSGRYADALPLYEELLEKKLRSLGESHEDVVTVRNNLGMMNYFTGRYVDALPHLRRTAEILRQHSAIHPMLAMSLKSLAAAHRKLGDVASAADVYRELIEVQRKTLNQNDPRIAETRKKLAETLVAGEEEPEREEQKAAEPEDEDEDEDEDGDASEKAQSSAAVAALHRQVARYYQDEQFPEAIDACEQLLELVRRQKGPDHEDTITTRENLATLRDAYGDRIGSRARALYQAGHFDTALPLAEQVLSLKRLAFGEEHAEFATSLNNVAELHRAMGKLQESERLHRRALEIRTAVCGEVHEDVAQSLNNLALTLEQLEKEDEVERLHRQALAIKRATIGDRSPGYATSLNNLASFYARTGRGVDAVPLARGALEIWRETGQAGSEVFARALEALANYEMQSGDPAAAEPLYRELLDRERKRLGKRHPDLAIHFNNLATSCHRQGKEEAEALYLEAIKRWRKSPDDRPSLVKALNNLVTYYQQRNNSTAVVAIYKEVLTCQQAMLAPNHPDIAATFVHLARTLRESGKFKPALTNAESAIQIRRSTLAPTDPALAEALNLRALAYEGLGDHVKAEADYREVVAIRTIASESDPSSYALSLFNLAASMKAQNRDTEAEAYFRQAGELWKNLRGASDPGYALSQAHIGGLCAGQGRYQEAEALYRESNDVLQRAFGEDHPTAAAGIKALGALYTTTANFTAAETLLGHAIDVYRKAAKLPALADALDSLVVCRVQQGRHAEALSLAQEMSAIRLAALGPEHPDITESQLVLATVLQQMGRYQEAEPLYRQALATRTRLLGASHPAVADVLNNLGVMYHESGRYDEAESLLRKAMKVVRRYYGEAHPNYGSSLNNLADLHRTMGDYRSAEEQYHQAFRIWRNALGTRHPLYATGLSNLGKLFSETGNHEAAKPLLDQALALRRALLDAHHPSIAQILKLRSRLSTRMGDDDDAIPMIEEALTIYRAAYGNDHANVAECLHDLAVIHSRGARRDQAESLHRQAIDIQMRTLGPRHPDVAASYYALAVYCAREGRAADAVAYAQQAEGIEDDAIQQIFSIGSERQRLQYLGTRVGRLDGLLSMVFLSVPQDESVRASAFNLVLRRKALVTESSAMYRRMLAGDRYPGLKPRLDEWAAVNMRIAHKALAGPGREPLDDHLRAISEWTRERDTLEAELAREIPEIALTDTFRRTDHHAVAAALAAGQSLVEFVRYHVFDFEAPKGGWKPARFCAFVLNRESASPSLVDLGEAAEIEQVIRSFRTSITGDPEESPGEHPESSHSTPSFDDDGRRLREALFDPLLPHVSGCSSLRLSLDGALCLLPFGVLPLADGSRVIDHYDISYLGTGRELLRRPTGVPTSSAVVVADPDFDLGSGGEPAAPPRGRAGARSARRSAATAQLRFDRLPGTRREGEHVGRALGISPLLGGEALEARVKAVRSPQVLHIATHGYFLPSAFGTPQALETLSGEDGGRDASAHDLDDPLLRSGLALAGANGRTQGFTPPEEAQDGILTAADVCGLDLHDTDLVVLSACQTGLGDIQVGEGVFGLRRAFMLAGAKSLVVSLWRVPDEPTRQLMAAFYARLLAGQPTGVALREAQLELKKTKADPYYWGAFVCHGDATVVIGRPAPA
jgi:tetratricopeptide (TPR) repeat protein/CHAT domain-containing protein